MNMKKNLRKDLILISELINSNEKVLDIGCGGGLISEPMARLGANVTGIDASEKNINIAKLHAKKSGLKINYLTAWLNVFQKKLQTLIW